MRERRSHSAQNEDYRQTAGTALHSFAVIQNIFSHGKAETHHAGVNYPIDNVVEFISLPEKQDQKNRCLGTLFHDWSGDYGGKLLADVGVVGRGRHDDLIRSV